MKRRTLFLALTVSALASPFPAKPAKKVQAETTSERGVGTGVTEKISPSAAPPPSCNLNYNGVFAIAVMKPSAPRVAASAEPSAFQAFSPPPDVAAPGNAAGLPPVGAATSAGKPAAVAASATPAAVPTGAGSGAGAGAGAKPAGGSEDESTVTLRSTRTHTRTVTVRRTVVGLKPAKASANVYMISQIGDGQIQAATKHTALPITTFSSAAPPPPPKASASTIVPVATAAPTKPQSTIAVVSQIGDGQPQAPGVAAARPKPAAGASAAAAPPAAAPAAHSAGHEGMAGMSIGSASMVRRQAPSSEPATQVVACQTKDTLQITLKDGVLKDAKGRTGYIASNFQFQFDSPPQSGSIYTAGFSVCGNGSLALGGSTTWYQCLSGNFYNLYDRSWAPQCSPITINAVMLKQC